MALLHEPLVHFFVVGGLILAVGRWLPGGEQDPAREIVVTRGRVENLAATFAKTWQRPPTAEELAGLVEEHVREEAAAREARALGLDQDDTVIRRRLRQKLEFVSEDLVAPSGAPTDAELEAWLRAHPEKYAREPRFSFRQLYLDPERRGTHVTRDGVELLAELRAGEAGASAREPVGDPSLLPESLADVALGEVKGVFGEAFAARLLALAPGEWQGPIESAYGVHLVRLDERVEARTPSLAEVHDAVRRDWEDARRVEAREAFYRSLLERYRVTLEPGAVPGDPRMPAQVLP